MNLSRFSILLSALLLAAVGQAWAHADFTGYSGAPGRGTCAGTCHGSNGGTIVVSGFPLHYNPNSTYLITIRRLSSNRIRNFNGSCRIGTGTQNAGVLSSGTGTATYNTNGETNGIHLSSNDRDSAMFQWTAPAAGTGRVTLYVAGLQGSYSGLNTVLAVTSDESALPGEATTPYPADGAANIPPNVVLNWVAGAGAESHDVYFGDNANPPFAGNVTDPVFDPADTIFQAGTTYYWRVDERNPFGEAAGPVWSFRTAAVNAAGERESALPLETTLGPVYPNPFNATLSISFALPQEQEVSLTLLNILGQPVARLAHGSFGAGVHHVQWRSESVGTGIYFLRLQSGTQTLTTKVVALK